MTEPLTPPDCDLRGLPFMPLDVVRVLDSDLFAIATGEEFKAAIALWCKAWLQVPAASLPDDDRVLAHLSGAGARWKKVKAMALRGFVKCGDGRLYHPVVAEKASDAWERRGDWQEKQNNKNERQERWRAKVKDMGDQLRRLGVTPPAGASLSTLERLLVDAQTSTYASTDLSRVDTREMSLTGTGTGTGTSIQLPDGNCADDEKPDLLQLESDKRFWDTAKAYLGASKASMIGKWVKAYGKPATAQAITAAQLERAVDPIPYIERTLRNAQARDEELPIC